MDSGPVATFQVHEHLRPKVIHSSKNYFMGLDNIHTLYEWETGKKRSEMDGTQ